MDTDEFDELDGLYPGPAVPAYQQTETRSGRRSNMLLTAVGIAPGATPASFQMEALAGRAAGESALGPYPTARDLVHGMEAAFYQACVSYLALQNMLAHANPPEFAERLLAMDRNDFDGWLADIARGGSVT